jgi:hypothetical protein
MVAADTPGGAVPAWALLCALIVKLGAELVPELITSTLSSRCVAIVAGAAGKGASRGGFARSIGCCKLIYMSRIGVREGRHGRLQLRIPDRTRLFYD